ncbi:MAG TPA: flagellar transcriptional regulator FlhC [Zoogloea sp.]|uniref:flagellar transcriptional regulator FlhC n=1 Tax=Zoogloea sp. TaxID=49181 RepID=UPI002BBD66A0|nr:flagellar transcriptional regulator FlhC [Zoogloea sp.]HMV16735.1 flagellar transcriptional regulator FlhC [Rhodocyclaceae bacterium]HMV64679.1 flagellar transcriptional regulator FlhC [Rhodocyclaceae bacterium]HMW50886.1 flagellar transcriptional regulator FlhC [Rhodocyclaceae bacterium]HMY49798.1 flagellar transcriptional regulator FlhC [Rhodocyclaceae bacterium]HMZ75551.1 flagellar transcriptional regulator FlhC [Rhodocyclaceae bacterium]
MRNKSVLLEAQDIQKAVELIRLGARMQMLEAETGLSRERLLKLYKEVKGVSPPKGMLPFSTDWFMSWQPNIHASLFMAFHRFVRGNAGLDGLNAIVQAFRLYQEHVESFEMEQVLSLTRAWTLIRFFDARLLQSARCTCCGGEFVTHAYDPTQHYVCGLCHVPSRAGKTRKAQLAESIAP